MYADSSLRALLRRLRGRRTILAGLERDADTRHDVRSEAALVHCTGKLDLKRGSFRQNNEDPERPNLTPRENRPIIDGAGTARMNALAGIRTLANNAEPSADHAARFGHAIGSLQYLSCACGGHKVYEAVSAIGTELTSAIAKKPAEDRRATVSFNRLVRQYETIVCENPGKLGNQPAVAVSFKWFTERQS